MDTKYNCNQRYAELSEKYVWRLSHEEYLLIPGQCGYLTHLHAVHLVTVCVSQERSITHINSGQPIITRTYYFNYHNILGCKWQIMKMIYDNQSKPTASYARVIHQKQRTLHAKINRNCHIRQTGAFTFLLQFAVTGTPKTSFHYLPRSTNVSDFEL